MTGYDSTGMCNVWQAAGKRATGCAKGEAVPEVMDALMASVMGILTDVC